MYMPLFAIITQSVIVALHRQRSPSIFQPFLRLYSMRSGANWKAKGKKDKKAGRNNSNGTNWTTRKPEIGPISTDSSAKKNGHNADLHENTVPPSSSAGSASESISNVASSMGSAAEQRDEVLPATIEGKKAANVGGMDAAMVESIDAGKSCTTSTGQTDSRGGPTARDGGQCVLDRSTGAGAGSINETAGSSSMEEKQQELKWGSDLNRKRVSGRDGNEGFGDGPDLATTRNPTEILHPGAQAKENSTGCKAMENESNQYVVTGGGGRGRESEGGRYGSTGGRGRGRDQGYRGGRGRGRDQDGGHIGGRGKGRGQDEGYSGSTYRSRQPDRIYALGRLLSTILRHKADSLGLNIRSDGYVPVQDLLKLKMTTFAGVPLCAHTIDDVKEAVRNDNKQRFGLVYENGEPLIRANQGHSLQAVDSEKLLRPISAAENFPVCVHGTYRRYLDSILETGLSRMGRRHVHFATGLPKDSGVISGMRGNCEILIYLDVKKALNDGMKIYLSENGVVLTEGFEGTIPPKYFAKIETWPSREVIHLKGRSS